MHTQQAICVGFGLDEYAFVCICWLIRKAKSIRRKIQSKRYRVSVCVCVLGCGHGSVCMCRVANERGRKHNRTNKQTIEVCVDWICCSVVVHQSIIRHACYRWTRYFHRLSIYSCMKTVHSNRIGGHAILNKRKAPNVAIRQCKHRRQRRQRENLEKVLRDGSSPQTTSATMGRRRKSWQIN